MTWRDWLFIAFLALLTGFVSWAYFGGLCGEECHEAIANGTILEVPHGPP